MIREGLTKFKFAPKTRLEDAIRSARDRANREPAWLAQMTRLEAACVFLLTALLYDDGLHELEEEVCEFQRLPWNGWESYDGLRFQGRQGVRQLDGEWIRIVSAAEQKLAVDRGPSASSVSRAIASARGEKKPYAADDSVGGEPPAGPGAHASHLVRWQDLVRFLEVSGVLGLDHRVTNVRMASQLPERVFSRKGVSPWFRLGEAWIAARRLAQNPARMDELTLGPQILDLLKSPGWSPEAPTDEP